MINTEKGQKVEVLLHFLLIVIGEKYWILSQGFPKYILYDLLNFT